jgi:hypothetical protein
MAEVKLTGKSMEQRIADRLKTFGDTVNADHHTVHGTGPTRTHTLIHSHGQGGTSRRVDLEKGGIKGGLGAPEEPGIDGSKRDVV